MMFPAESGRLGRGGARCSSRIFPKRLRSVKDGLLELGVPVHNIEPPLLCHLAIRWRPFFPAGLTSDLMRIPVLGAPVVSRRARRGRRRRIFLHDLSNSLPPWRRLSVDEFMEFNLLITLISGCLKFIAGKPTCQRGLPRRLRSEYKPKSCDNCVTGRIQMRPVFVARMISVANAPLRAVSSNLYATGRSKSVLSP